jgi:hypothetical protein
MFSKFISAFFLLFIFSVGQSQTQYKAVPNDENSILVEGTSNIHDWEIQVENFNSEIDLSLKEGIPKSINTFTISIPVKSFNSGKNSMDKNTYKAMEADTYTKISFTSSTKALLNLDLTQFQNKYLDFLGMTSAYCLYCNCPYIIREYINMR